MYEAFPLHWPQGYARAEKRLDSQFKMTPDKARKELVREIELLSGDKNPVVSSNVNIRKDGNMYADMASDKIKDPGVAVYFNYNDRQVSLACDAWLTPAENIRALGLTVGAMRGMERWGCSEILNRSFTGFTALPASNLINQKSIWEILGFKSIPSEQAVHDHYKMLAKERHPDKPTGSVALFQELNDAYQLALNYFKKM